MVYRCTVDATIHVFADLRDLLAKATPPRSGDRLAGIAAESAEQMIAARIALADVPLKQFLQEAVIPYEGDEITPPDRRYPRPPSLRAGFLADDRRVPRLAVVGRGDHGGSCKARARHYARNGRGGLEADA